MERSCQWSRIRAGDNAVHLVGLFETAVISIIWPDHERCRIRRVERRLDHGTCLVEPHRFTMLTPAEEAPQMLHEDGKLHVNWGAPFKAGVSLEQVLAEMDLQLARARALGFDICYADTHMNFHHQEGWAEPTADWCRANDLIWFDDATQGWTGGKDDEESAAKLRDLEDDVVIAMVKHPCFADDEMRDLRLFDGPTKTPVGQDRDLQRRCFMDPVIMAAVEERGIIPTRIDEL